VGDNRAEIGGRDDWAELSSSGLEEGELERQRWAVWRGCRQRQRLGVAVADG